MSTIDKKSSNWMKKLFGMDFEEEGSGVIPENENPFSVFWGIFFRKFWALVRLNLMHTGLTLPAFALSALVLSGMLFIGGDGGSDAAVATRLFTGFLLINLQLVTVGPCQAGFIYVLKLFSREINAFLVHDYMKGLKENLKQSLAVGAIDILVTAALILGFRFYSLWSARLGWLGYLCTAVVCIIAFFFVVMHFYIYPMLVMLKVTMKQLYGNAIRFALGFVFQNILILAVQLLFVFLVFYNTALGLILIVVFGYSFTGLFTTFWAVRKIDECIISKLPPEQREPYSRAVDPVEILKGKKGGEK